MGVRPHQQNFAKEAQILLVACSEVSCRRGLVGNLPLEGGRFKELLSRSWAVLNMARESVVARETGFGERPIDFRDEFMRGLAAFLQPT